MATSNSFYCYVGSSSSFTLSSPGNGDILYYQLQTSTTNLNAFVEVEYLSNGDTSCVTRITSVMVDDYYAGSSPTTRWVKITNPNGSTTSAYKLRPGSNSISIRPNWDTTWSKGTSQAQTTKSLVITFYTNSACTNEERHWTFYIRGTIGAKTQYTNTYYPNGGSGSNQTQTHYYGSAFTTKTTSTFSRTNYTLSKWNTTASGSGTNYTANTSYTVNSNLSLYAQWTQVYASPQITINKAYRCDANGDADDEGRYAAVECSFSIWNASGNAVNATEGNLPTCTVNSEPQTASIGDPSTTINTYSSSLTTSGNWLTGKCYFVVDADMDTDASYTALVSIKDVVGGTTVSGASTSSNTGTKTATISTAFYTIDVLEGGHGIAFGMPAKSEGFYVGMPFHAHTLSNPNDPGNSKAGIIHQSLDFSSTASVSTNTRVTSTSDRDMNGVEVGYSEIFRTSIPSMYRSFAVKNPTSGLVSAIYLHSLDDGTRYITSVVPNRLLWSGAIWPTTTQTATLAANVTDQLSGIVLCWSAYSSSSGSQNYDWNYTFIPKYHVASHNTTGVSAICVSSKFGAVGTKYVYVHDNKIVGNDGNDDTGTASGITFRNNYWVLRYVIGV